MQDDLLLALNEIEDPELGIGIVDLGLVYRADWTEKGIDVEITITSLSCPVGEVLREQAEDSLRRRFGEASSIRVTLVLDPPWTADRITENARQKLGWVRQSRPSKRSAEHGPGGVFGSWKH
jgi:metal-sulfur cluster biosynthetic enzyme